MASSPNWLSSYLLVLRIEMPASLYWMLLAKLLLFLVSVNFNSNTGFFRLISLASFSMVITGFGYKLRSECTSLAKLFLV